MDLIYSILVEWIVPHLHTRPHLSILMSPFDSTNLLSCGPYNNFNRHFANNIIFADVYWRFLIQNAVAKIILCEVNTTDTLLASPDLSVSLSLFKNQV